ncbi:Immunoglobulin V-set domain [Trinorchestia longiramus]|nr:Immunoglobulin V-set domain [Trinorchestia longiramus]
MRQVTADFHLLLEVLLLIHYGSGHTNLQSTTGSRYFHGKTLHNTLIDEHNSTHYPNTDPLADIRTNLSFLTPQDSPTLNWTTTQFFLLHDANRPMRSRKERLSDTLQRLNGTDLLFTKRPLTNSKHGSTNHKDILSDHFSSLTNRVRHRRATSNLRRSLNRSSEQTFKTDIKKHQESQDSNEENSELISTESSSRRERQAGKGPYFDPKSPREVKVAIGTTAHVPCMARNIGTKQVSWIRNRDLHVLTVGAFSFTTDERFSAHRDTITKDWVLIIQHTGLEDSGNYECSVPTKPVTSHTVQLKVLVPRTELVGTSEVHLERGSALNLTCLVHDSPAPPEFILWYHKDKLVNYGSSSGSISSGSSSGSISSGSSAGSAGAARVRVQTSHQRDTSRSSLLVQNATTRDSGRYYCEPSNAPKAIALVHVIPSEDPAAMQTTNSAHTSVSGVCVVVAVLLCILLTHCVPERSRLQSSVPRPCSDEKTFSVDPLVNKQNDRIVSFSQGISELRNGSKNKHPASVMMFGVVASNGEKMLPVWFPRGYRLNASAYKDVFVTKIVPWDFWPPQSPDLNPLDCSVWTHIENKACKVSLNSVEELKFSVNRSWATMRKDYICEVYKGFRPRLSRVIAAEGGQIEK